MKICICDLDKTLLPYGGTILDDKVRDKMITLQEKGMQIVLASARLAGGVFPIAKQINMDLYHGYVIADNGSFLYDMQKDALIKGYEIPLNVCDEIISYAQKHALHAAFEQGTYSVATNYDEGIAQDRENCGIDVILTKDVKKYIRKPIYKCLITEKKDLLDRNFEPLKAMLDDRFGVFRSADTVIDVICKGCSKEAAVAYLLKELQIPALETVAIGDGNSDANMIKLAGLGITLENGSDLCKQYADMVVPSCYEDGCLKLFDFLLDSLQSK